MTRSDHELLTAYARDGSEAAFTELVRRHAGAVHAAALRQTRNPQLAEEVMQAVFVRLAQKAGSLNPQTVVLGWLLRAARYAAIDAVRAEVRRQERQQTLTMDSPWETASGQPEDHDPLWERVAPVLDEAIHRLSSADRAAVLLRFFQGKSLAEVGVVLGVAEDAARKRVGRALDKLHRQLTQLGATASPAVLPTLLLAKAAPATSAALEQTVLRAAFNSRTGPDPVADLAQGIARQTLWAQLQSWFAAAAVVLLLVGAVWMAKTAFPTEANAVSADGDYRVAGFADPREVHRFVGALQSALRSGDRAALARLVGFPLAVNTPAGVRQFANATEFIAMFDSVLPAPTAALVLKSPRERLYADARGVMVGDGAVWIAPVPGSQPVRPQVIAFNVR